MYLASVGQFDYLVGRLQLQLKLQLQLQLQLPRRPPHQCNANHLTAHIFALPTDLTAAAEWRTPVLFITLYQNHDDEAAGAAAGGGAAPGSERRHACATALASGSPLRAS